MTSEIDIYRSANLLIQKHGDEAAIFAALEADACFERGDHAGKLTWLRIISTIEELQKATPDDPGTLH